MKRFLLSSFWIFVLTGLMSVEASCASRTVYVKKAPPVVIVKKRSSKPFANALWISGHWAWKSGKYVWVKGNWAKPRAGFVWIPGHWVKKRRGWVWISGYWKKR